MTHALRLTEVAQRLDIQRKTVGKLIRIGSLPAFDISLTSGGRPSWRVLESDLKAFIEQRQHRIPTPRRRRRRPSQVTEFF